MAERPVDGIPRGAEDEELVRLSFLVTKQERAKLKVKAAEAEVTMSEILREAVEDFIAK